MGSSAVERDSKHVCCIPNRFRTFIHHKNTLINLMQRFRLHIRYRLVHLLSIAWLKDEIQFLVR